MQSINPSSPTRVVAGQALDVCNPGRCVDNQPMEDSPSLPLATNSKKCNASSVDARQSNSLKLDTLMLRNVSPSYTYNALHNMFKNYGTVLRIRIIYDDDGTFNRCYINFISSDEAKCAYDAAASLDIGMTGFKAELLSSRNISTSDLDYVPNMFEDAANNSVSKVREEPLPRWFVAYYRGGHGNYIHASRYLTKEVGKLTEGNLKKYGKGVLIRANSYTQAKMLQNMPCLPDSMFESIKPHRTFNHCKGCVYNHDLYEFPEEEILNMCPDTVHRVRKIKGRANMILLVFHGSRLPDMISIGPLDLKVKTFIERPHQCYGCYKFGHSKQFCSESPRCGNCSALDSHMTEECNSDPYCYVCRESHPLHSRYCPQYRLEQDILHLANTQFISLGAARRELGFRQQREGRAKTYAANFSTVSSSQPTGQHTNSRIPQATPRPSGDGGVRVENRYSILESRKLERIPLNSTPSSSTRPTTTTKAQSTNNNSRPKGSLTTIHKRHRGSTESVDFVVMPPPKVSVGSPSRTESPEVVHDQKEPAESRRNHSSLENVNISLDHIVEHEMKMKDLQATTSGPGSEPHMQAPVTKPDTSAKVPGSYATGSTGAIPLRKIGKNTVKGGTGKSLTGTTPKPRIK